jgi:NADH dehydrogenase (ubiquinone) 1 alpha subcomplex subunit 9
MVESEANTHRVDRNFDLEDVHVEGAERIAEAVAKYDVDRFIHVSSYNADKTSPSEFFKTKVCQV